MQDNYILCVLKDSLKESPHMQKQKAVLDVLNKVEFFPTESIPDEYVPVSFATTLRTACTNLVVENISPMEVVKLPPYSSNKNFVEEHTRYTYAKFLSLTDTTIDYKGLDLLMYMSGLAVNCYFDTTSPEASPLVMTSQFLPIGLYNPDMGLCNPIFYSQVIFNDGLNFKLKDVLYEGNCLVPISEMHKENNLPEILKQIVIVKEEK